VWYQHLLKFASVLRTVFAGSSGRQAAKAVSSAAALFSPVVYAMSSIYRAASRSAWIRSQWHYHAIHSPSVIAKKDRGSIKLICSKVLLRPIHPLGERLIFVSLLFFSMYSLFSSWSTEEFRFNSVLLGIASGRAVTRRGRYNPRGAKQKVSHFNLRKRGQPLHRPCTPVIRMLYI
jgi:hypothetical protein